MPVETTANAVLVNKDVDYDGMRSTRNFGRPSTMKTPVSAITIYIVAFVTGAIVMSFEMLGSRYLNPYFGSGIYTWAALISTVLAALTTGYFFGGWLADRSASATVLSTVVLAASFYLVCLPTFADKLIGFVLLNIDDVRAGTLVAALAVMFLPVMLYGVYSPFAIRLVLNSTERSGSIVGGIYGVSTLGSIVGTLGTTFVLIPTIGTRAITSALGAAGLVCGLLLIGPRLRRRPAVLLVALTCAALAAPTSRAEPLFDEHVRAAMLGRDNGRIAHVETLHTDLYIDKVGSMLMMSLRYKRDGYVDSMTNLRDPDELPLAYSRTITASLAYPQDPKRLLMIGLGAGSISTYLGRQMPDLTIDAVEVDPGVIVAAKTYFGIRETDKVRFIENDGRVFLTRNRAPYDVIMVDACQRLGVPFHLLTREFYLLVKQHLVPGGVVAVNVIGGTKLYASTLVTVSTVFPTVDVYPVDAQEGQMIVMASVAGPEPEALLRRAAAMQDRYGFRYPLPGLIAQRHAMIPIPNGELLTDDFAPVNLYETMATGARRRR